MSNPYSDDRPNPFEANPYRVTETNYSPIGSAPVGTIQLASLSQRFFGAMIDAFLPMLFVVPGYLMAIVGVVMAQNQAELESDPVFPWLAILGMAIIGFGFLVTLFIQIYLLATRSQTLGKYFLKTQVVDFETGQPADFVHCAVLRILVNSIIAGIPCVGFIYAIVDICYIFRDDRRCIHDLIASTTVIDISHL